MKLKRRPIPNAVREQAWGQLFSSTRKAGSAPELRKRLSTLLTAAELFTLEKRLAIRVLLEQGMSYKKIGRLIDVTPTTISFVKYNLVRNPLKGLLMSLRKQYDFPVEGKPRRSHSTIPTVLGEVRRQQRLGRR